MGRSGEWVHTRTGIRELRTLATDETLLDLAVRAGTAALADARLDPSSVDLVIAASCSLRTGRPQLSAQIAGAIAPKAAALDLNAACAGFCYSLAAADTLIGNGSARTVLVVGAEHMTGIVDPADRGTSIIFADGAGAAVLGRAPDDRLHLGPPAWGSDGANADLIAMPAELDVLTMAGTQVFRWAVEQMHHVALEACTLAGVTTDEIAAFVPHQANARIVDALAGHLGLGHAVVSHDVSTSGNTSAASIPIAITNLRRDGHRLSGELALVIGFGAGLTYAAQVLRLP